MVEVNRADGDMSHPGRLAALRADADLAVPPEEVLLRTDIMIYGAHRPPVIWDKEWPMRIDVDRGRRCGERSPSGAQKWTARISVTVNSSTM
ncbi:hypothetical protein [Nonomuraea dietziae]|uniref:hypothetical protein n=1 Tax=Nonomuraea dietziae TaxID=65515 RepID=UPI0034211099